MNSMRPWRFRKYSGDSDIAIDFGTANTRLYVLGRGVVADEPTRVEAGDGNSLDRAVHLRAGGKRSNELVVPLRAGVVSDIDAAVRRQCRRTIPFGGSGAADGNRQG